MAENIHPNACRVKGNLFVGQQRTFYCMNYIDRSWEIYTARCRPRAAPPHEMTMTMRCFLWMLKDFKMINKELTASKFVEVIAEDNPFISATDSNFELELVFLEFFEALLSFVCFSVTNQTAKSCGSVFSGDLPESRYTSIHNLLNQTPSAVPSQDSDAPRVCALSSSSKFDVSKIKKPESSAHQSLSSERTPKLNYKSSGKGMTFIFSSKEKSEKLKDEAKDEKDEQKEKLSTWLGNMHVFFVDKLFAAHRHEELVKEKVKENRLRLEALAGQERLEDEQLEARLQSLKEEESRKQDYETDASTKDTIVTSMSFTQSPPKEEPLVSQPSKAGPSRRRRK